jgi:hypothetical protein
MFLAVIGLVLGIGGICCTPLSIIGLLFPGTPENNTFNLGTTTVTMPPPDGLGLLGLIITSLVSLLCSALLLTGSGGSLALKGWGRTAMLIYAPLTIVNNAAHTIISAAIYAEPISEQMAAGMPEPMSAAAMSIGMIVGTLCAILCQSIYPLAVIVVYNLKSVRDAFDGRPPEGGGGMPPGGVDPVWPPPVWPGYQGYQPPADPKAPPPVPPTAGWGPPPPPPADPSQQPPPDPRRW